MAPASGHIALLTNPGVKVSTDGGSSWNLSSTGLPVNYFFYTQHNQLAAAPNNPDHLSWALTYNHNGPHLALLRSTDFGSSWNILINNAGTNRPPIVRTALDLSGDSSLYDVYFADGGGTLERATADVSGSSISSWTTLSIDHSDPADIAFSTDSKTPLLLATDGGLHKSADGGLTWKLTGGGAAGYDALQITDMTGQLHQNGLSTDLYFATQDNSIWGSPDEGASWPASFDSEGFYLNIPRDFYPPSQTHLTGMYCMPCNYFIAGPVFLGISNFSNAPGFVLAPRLLQPATYLQQTEITNVPSEIFSLTTNTGVSWNPRYGISESVLGLPQPAGPANDPVIYHAIHPSGTSKKGYALILLKRVSDVLGNLTPLVSDVTGFGSLGYYANMLGSSLSFGVDPNDSNYLIVSDVDDSQVKVSTDAGATWTPDKALTDLVTESGQLRFDWSPGFTQTTTFAFDPDCTGHVVVGTQQAGIFETFDRGAKWQKVSGSELIPQVTSIFFDGNGNMIISSYGRGLWKYAYSCPVKPLTPAKLLQFAEPLIYWKGARVPIRQIHDPEVCPACGYFFLKGGKVLDYKTALGTNKLLEVNINNGVFQGYTWNGGSLPVPFKVTKGKGQTQGGLAPTSPLQSLPSVAGQLQGSLPGRSQIKGLFMEGDILRGLILATDDLTIADLPKFVPLGPHIRLSEQGPIPIDELGPLVVTGTGFAPGIALEVVVDRKIIQLESPPVFDAQGDFTFSFTPPLSLGLHTILVRQVTPSGLTADIAAFTEAPHDSQR